MDKICYLHIGSPKTGSTSIQAACFRNRTLLESRSILYPGGHRRHNALVSAFHAEASGLRFNQLHKDLSQPGVAEGLIDQEMEQVAASGARRVLYSNELLLGQVNHLDLVGLRDRLQPHFAQIRVLCYLRDPYKLLISRAQEVIKSGARTYRNVVAQPPVMDMAGLSAYARVFGQQALILRNFDDIVASKVPLLADCLGTILPGIMLQGFEHTGVKNASLSLEAALIMSGLNAHHGLKSDWAGRHLRAHQLRGVGQTKFTLPRTAVLAVRDKLLAQYEILHGYRLNFSPPDWEALPDPQPDWSEQTLEQVALLMNSLSGAGERLGARKGGKGTGSAARRTIKNKGEKT